ncbi:MAG TPA: hypothetical protein VK897_04630 [Anaerolineales bacterium]|nr:hypothetical protein [Anaerolineales bacterium]
MTKWLAKYSIIIVFVVITVGAFVFGLLLLLGIWGALRAIGYPTNYWAMLEALATAIAASAVLGTVFVAYTELSEVYNSRYIDVANKLFDELNSPENIAARRWIFQKLPDDPVEGIKTLPPEGRDAVKKVLNSLDHVAFLTQAGWIPDELVMPWMYPMISKSWLKLKPYVEYERQRRNEPYYYINASNVAERCLLWGKANLPESEKVIWVPDAL